MNFLSVCSRPDEWESCSKARRVAIHCLLHDNFAGPHVRSLLFFDKKGFSKLECSNFRVLRVLHFEWVNCGAHAELQSFRGACLLRYLKLVTNIRCKESEFGEWVGSMKYLQTLDLLASENHDLPNLRWQAKTLRHVLFNAVCRYIEGPTTFKDLINLQTLTGVRWNKSWKTSVLPNIPNIRVLSIKIDGEISQEEVTSFLSRQRHLVSLWIKGDALGLDWKYFPFYENLKTLYLGKHDYARSDNILPQFVHLVDNMFPPNLTYLSLQAYEFGSDPMVVLEKLGSLKVLYLWSRCRDEINERAVRRIKCSSGGFKQLQKLTLWCLPLEELEIEMGAMPMLKVLFVDECDPLQVPPGLIHLQSLQQLFWYTNIKANKQAIRQYKEMKGPACRVILC